MPPKPQRVIEAGFLPENLPPVYSSTSLWEVYSAHSGSYLVTTKAVGAHATFNSSKRGNQRRLFGLPHPTFIFDQATFFERHWDELEGLLHRSPGSQSIPNFSQNSSRAIRITAHSELPAIRLKTFSRYKFCLVADIARFFPSIYTHAIPWSINGRERAKTDRNAQSASVFGNRLDFICRQSQNQQTIGIPVGPDTSKVTSELLLSAVDELMLKKGRRPLSYVRHVDDYWIGGKSVEECEDHLQSLRAALRAFELDINELKTKILPTNFVLGETWPSDFDSELIRALIPRSNDSAVAILSRIIDRANKENDDGMIRFAIKRIDERHLWNLNWNILEHFIAQCAVQFSHSIDYVARVVAWKARTGQAYDRSLWMEVALSAASRAAGLGRDSEVVWALWLMKELKIKVPRRLSEAIALHNSPLVLGYLAHLHANGLANSKDLIGLLWQRVEGPTSGVSWPLSLELKYLQIPDPVVDRPGSDGTLMLLHDNGKSLIDWNAAPRVFAARQPNDDDDEPIYAIEDFAGDYGGDEVGDIEDEPDDEIAF